MVVAMVTTAILVVEIRAAALAEKKSAEPSSRVSTEWVVMSVLSGVDLAPG